MNDEPCPSCGMERDEWATLAGFENDGKTYCCRGCAEGAECTCTTAASEETEASAQ